MTERIEIYKAVRGASSDELLIKCEDEETQNLIKRALENHLSNQKSNITSQTGTNDAENNVRRTEKQTKLQEKQDITLPPVKIKVDKQQLKRLLESQEDITSISQESNVGNKVKKQRPKNVFQCEDCDMQYVKKHNLVRHRLVVHEEAHTCNNCKKIFKGRQEYLTHIATHPSSYQCEVCNFTFPTEYNLKKHAVCHKPRQYRCAYCRKGFRVPHALTAHLKKTGHKVVKCDECGANFQTRNRLLEHQLSHDRSLAKKAWELCSLKPHSKHMCYVCDICNTAFINENHLKLHRLKHFGVALNCKLCKVTFQLERSFFVHMKKHDSNFTVEDIGNLKHEKLTSLLAADDDGNEVSCKIEIEDHPIKEEAFDEHFEESTEDDVVYIKSEPVIKEEEQSE